jgi:hypothetical protein
VNSGEAKSQNTYIPLSRGIEPYLGVYSSSAIVAYIQIGLRAIWKVGPDHGTVELSLGPNRRLEEQQAKHPIGVLPNLAGRLGMDRKTARRVLAELAKGHKVGILTRTRTTAPPFIEILETRGKTKDKTFIVRILKAKLSARQFEPRTHARPPARGDDQELDLKDPKDQAQAIVAELVDQVAGTVDVKHLFGEKFPE